MSSSLVTSSFSYYAISPVLKVMFENKSRAVAIHSFNPSTLMSQETEVGGSLQIRGQSGLQCEYQDGECYTETLFPLHPPPHPQNNNKKITLPWAAMGL